MKRVYHHYTKREEFAAGMWKITAGEERQGYLEAVIEFMKDTEKFGRYMMRAVEEWPYSCEANFTCSSINKQAWVGHAACCIALGCPEDVTRLGWHSLNQQEQDSANAVADEAIEAWMKRYKANHA